MKTLLILFLFMISILQSETNFNQNTYQQKLKLPLFVKQYINKNNCDNILRNKNYFTTCYNYQYKSSIYAYIKIDGSKVNEGNIKKRPQFYDDLNLLKKYRTTYKDYTNSGFDRGHGIANDASNDYSLKSQKMTYVMSQIYPQYPNTNRKSYLKVEKYEREIASKLGFIHSFMRVNFSYNPKKIGRNKVSVPNSFDKVYWNQDNNFYKCFRVPNDNIIYKLKDMVIDCNIF